MDATNTRLKGSDFAKNPFLGKVSRIKEYNGEGDCYAVIMDAIYPRFYLIGYLWLFIYLLFRGLVLSWWLLPGLIMASLGIFWSKWFLIVMLRVGLRKAGYDGKIKHTSNEEILRLIV